MNTLLLTSLIILVAGIVGTVTVLKVNHGHELQLLKAKANHDLEQIETSANHDIHKLHVEADLKLNHFEAQVAADKKMLIAKASLAGHAAAEDVVNGVKRVEADVEADEASIKALSAQGEREAANQIAAGEQAVKTEAVDIDKAVRVDVKDIEGQIKKDI